MIMAERDTLDPRENDILSNIEQAILNGTRCFESDGVDDNAILLELRQSSRNIRLLHLDSQNARQIEEAITALIDQIEFKRNGQHDHQPFVAQCLARTGGRGRPSAVIEEQQLQMMYKLGYSASKMAEHFGCSTQLIYRELYSHGLKQRERYTHLNDQELDEKVSALQTKYPNAGSVMMHGYLQTESVNVPRQRLRQSMNRVNPVSVAQRRTKTTKRRKYSVPMANSLWHMDGHMKLIRWGTSTHGCIDGHSRTITFLEANNNNHASTVLRLLIDACKKFGVPSSIRTARGGENMMVALFVTLINGEDRHSHIPGRSVHNQRIERLWKDVFTQVIQKYYSTFSLMEERGILDVENEIHLAVLHFLCLPAINKELSQFQESWNRHRLSSEGNSTPYQLWLDSVLTNINSGSTPISNLYGASLEETFRQKLLEYDIPTEADQERENEAVLSDDTVDQLILVSDDSLTIEQNFTACMLKLTELNIF